MPCTSVRNTVCVFLRIIHVLSSCSGLVTVECSPCHSWQGYISCLGILEHLICVAEVLALCEIYCCIILRRIRLASNNNIYF